MKTIKLPYTSNEDLTTINKQYSNVVRWSYNRFCEKMKEKDIRELSSSLNNIELLNSWLVQCAILDGMSINKRFKDNKVIFGGKTNFINLITNKISKNEFQIKRLTPINIQGEFLQKGNRSFKLDIIENNQIIFKLNKNKHIKLQLPKLRNNIKKELFKLQEINEVKQGETGYTFSIRLDLKNIYISFEEFKDEKIKLNEDRYLSIDLNPDTIGISIHNNKEIIYTQEYSLKLIFDKIINNAFASSNKELKYFQNKLNFETIEISKSIVNLAKHYNCDNVFIEDLKFKQKLAKDQKRNHLGNRKCKNLWKKEKFIENISKRLYIAGINLRKINPAYTSFIGNMVYDYTDAINASIEIGRRGYEYFINKDKTKFYPDLLVKHQWKEMATKYTDWKKFYLEAKNLKLKYRVSLYNVKYNYNVFKQNSIKSMVLNYVFYD